MDAYRDLVAAMDAQLGVLEDLVALEGRKTALLVAGTPGELAALVQEEQALLVRLDEHEARRRRAAAALAAALAVPEGELTLARLAAGAPAPWQQALAACQRRYAAACGELGRRLRHNRELLRGALAYVEFALQALGAARPAGSGYNASGQAAAAGAPLRPVLDGRA